MVTRLGQFELSCLPPKIRQLDVVDTPSSSRGFDARRITALGHLVWPGKHVLAHRTDAEEAALFTQACVLWLVCNSQQSILAHNMPDARRGSGDEGHGQAHRQVSAASHYDARIGESGTYARPSLASMRPASLDRLLQASRWPKDKVDAQNWAGNVFAIDPAPEDLQKYWQAQIRNADNREAWSYFDAGSEEPAGYCEITDINPAHRSARLEKFIIGPSELRGAGRGTAFLHLFVERASTLGVHRLDLMVTERNSAVRLYEKNGFVIEGTLRDARRYDDQYLNLLIMSRLLD